MIFWCQSCGEQHTSPHVTSANITTCPKCGGSSFATWKPTQSQSLSQEAVRDEALEEAARVCEAEATKGEPFNMIRSNTAKDCAEAIRALKCEPNVGRQEQPAMRQETGAHLPDGSAPKVCPCCHQALAYHIPRC